MSTNSTSRSRVLKRLGWGGIPLIGLILAGVYVLGAGEKKSDVGTTFVARRGPLDITVLEGGSIESEEKGEIKCEVKGGQGVKILKIVEEGYQVTTEDVNNKKVLVELDSADLVTRITTQEISLASTAASLTDAQQGYEIQVNQNLSDVMAAVQKARFARMDFDKYMGDQAAEEIITQLGIQTEPSEEVPSPTNLLSPASPNDVNAAAAAPTAPSIAVDFSKYADIDLLGDGEARQKLRELRDALQVAQKEQQQAQSALDGTQRLFEKDFVTKTDLERDQLSFENSVLKVKKADTAYSLFEKYEFPKAAEEALSKYTEALRELDRTKKGGVSRLAQAEAKLKSAQARYSVEERQLKDLREQFDKCTIRAPRPGLVVYGGGDSRYYWREEQVREGATMREGQTVLTIPDMRKICIKVKIHESYIKKIQKGLKVQIKADAYPDRKLEGEVSQVGMLPDSVDSWLNPGVKVYRTTVKIMGEHDWIKPGMTAKVEILVNHLDDVVHVPIQAVNPIEDKKVCYVVNGSTPEEREVEVGEFNDEFIEIKKGIKEGEKVCLRTPAGMEGAGDKDKKKASGPEEGAKTGDGAASATSSGAH